MTLPWQHARCCPTTIAGTFQRPRRAKEPGICQNPLTANEPIDIGFNSCLKIGSQPMSLKSMQFKTVSMWPQTMHCRYLIGSTDPAMHVLINYHMAHPPPHDMQKHVTMTQDKPARIKPPIPLTRRTPYTISFSNHHRKHLNTVH